MHNRVEGAPLGFLISGNTGGTGGSSTAKELSECLGFPVISGGVYFRGLAERFNTFLLEESAQFANQEIPDKHKVYEKFLGAYTAAFKEGGLEGVNALLREGTEKVAVGDVLTQFNTILKERLNEYSEHTPLWDYIVDFNALHNLLGKQRFILESKLAILALTFDEVQHVVGHYKPFILPFLRVLLRVNPEIAAYRVGERENRNVTVEEILQRQAKDFHRYGTYYKINGKPVVLKDLEAYADVVIDTEQNKPHRVAELALFAYLQKLRSITSVSEAVTLPAIKTIKDGLEKLGV